MTTVKRSARAIARLTWRQVLHTATWTRTGHGVYTHADGRVVRVSGGGTSFVRYDTNGVRLSPPLQCEEWPTIRNWAVS